MKIKSFEMSLLIIIISLIAVPVFANPIVVRPSMFVVPIFKLILFFLTTVIIEFIIAYIFLNKNITKTVPLLISIFIVNVITFPITQVFAMLIIVITQIFNFLHTYYNQLFYIAELFPFIAEFFLLKWQLTKLYERKILVSEMTNKKILLIDVTMNLATFIFGIVFGILMSLIHRIIFLISAMI